MVDYLNRSIFALSSGEKQQIAIGSVYALEPKVYIFDEPSANLDYGATKRLAEIMEKLKHAGYTIFVVEHRFYYLRDLIDRAFLIQNGKIEHEFTREQFCSLPEETRLSYGLRTAYPERDAEHYQERPNTKGATHQLEVHNLGFAYKKVPDIFQNVSFEAHAGDVIGILGHNGAGKTTTMKMLLGLTKPTSGEVKIWGKSLQGNEKKLLPRIGSLIESPGFYPNLTATENLQIFATLRGIPNRHSIKNTLDLVGLPYKDKKLFSQYSLGMKQRLAIALAVMHDPELLILDEPINGLDPIGIAEVRSFIRELCDTKGKTILISSHILSEISLLADDIGIIDHGALLEEESLAELEQKSSKHIRFTLSDTAQAARILERTFHESHFSIQDDHNLRLHNLDLSVGKIVTAFVENGLEVSEAHTCEESLEDYFKRVTGGEGIA